MRTFLLVKLARNAPLYTVMGNCLKFENCVSLFRPPSFALFQLLLSRHCSLAPILAALSPLEPATITLF